MDGEIHEKTYDAVVEFTTICPRSSLCAGVLALPPWAGSRARGRRDVYGRALRDVAGPSAPLFSAGHGLSLEGVPAAVFGLMIFNFLVI